MATYFLDGPDELAKLEFVSRQKLLMEDKIMKNKINNYVQLVHALTGQEVFMPANDDDYSYVSVSDDDDDEEEEYYEEEVIEDENGTEYEIVEEVSVGVDDFLLESVRTDPGAAKDLKIENLAMLEDIPEAPPMVDNAPPPTPSQIIRKLKATLVQTTMCQIRNTKHRKSVKKLGDSNWSYDMAKRRLDRELKRIQKRRAYRDAVERLPELTRTMQEEETKQSDPPNSSTTTTTSTEEKLAEKDAKAVAEASKRPTTLLQRQLSRRGSLSGSVFAGLLHNLERLPSGSVASSSQQRRGSGSMTSSSQRASSSARKTKRQYRSDQRLQAILKKHHKNLKEEKARLQTITSPIASKSELPLETIISQSELPPPPPEEEE